MARPTKYTPDVVKRLTDAISMGATYELAAKYGGITYETFKVWRAAKPSFSSAVEEAEGRAAVGWLAKIERAANDGSWQAAAWKLERRYPQDYGRTIQEHTGKDGGPVQHEVTVRAVDYRASIRELRPIESVERDDERSLSA